MDHFAGLDVSVKETNVCIVDDTGKIVREVKVASEPEALLAVSKNPAYRSMSLVPRCDRGEWGLGFPEIRKKRRLVDCSDVHDQRDESDNASAIAKRANVTMVIMIILLPCLSRGFPGVHGSSVPTGRPLPM